jgi:CDP-glucose 4,6-dehydratase
MAGLNKLDLAFQKKRVLVTGHTGFKGSWLCLWLLKMNAKVTGFSLAPSTAPSMFDMCNISKDIEHIVGDIRNQEEVDRVVEQTQPDFIFHMAAQALVQPSYSDPLATLSVNVIGTAHVLEAVRKIKKSCSVVVVTSDKCYANKEWVWGYRENEPLGGHDPYSMSKAAAELVVESWRKSFFESEASLVLLASARAGNVIGGGDWAEGRIIKDTLEASLAGDKVILRNPNATRPWQHVLEPLSGYLWLAAKLAQKGGQQFADAWNFGPNVDSVWPVSRLVDEFMRLLGGPGWSLDNRFHPHEAMSLSLSIEKARHKLKWQPVWTLPQTISMTAVWYKAWAAKEVDMRGFSDRQIETYCADAEQLGVSWALDK